MKSCAELCSASTTKDLRQFPLRLIFSKIIKLFLIWKHYLNRHFPNREFRKIVLNLLLCSPSTIQHNFSFFEILIFENLCSKKYFKVQKSSIILVNINLSGNYLKSLLLCSPSTTEHNFFHFSKF